MPAHPIANVEVTSEEWIPVYAANVRDIVHKHGCKYLSRSANITTLEGAAPDVSMNALLEFPSVDAVKAFADVPAHAEYSVARQAGSVSRFCVIDDTADAGTVSDLEKG